MGLLYRRNVPGGKTEFSPTSGTRPSKFFGDSVLNNTSLVLWIEARTGTRNNRLLFPGDLENWTYLFFRNPRGLQTDVFKASHHGGRIYLESDEADEELFSQLRPHIVLISANGRHGLPHAKVRETAARWGATVFCTCIRDEEIVVGNLPSDGCCHENLRCKKTPPQDVDIVMDATGIRGLVRACHNGLGGNIGPVIQVRQHIIDQSPIIGRLFEHELRRHIYNVREILRKVHIERRASSGCLTTGSEPWDHKQIVERESNNRRRADLRANIDTVLSEGMARGEFWAVHDEGVRPRRWLVYSLLGSADVRYYIRLLSKKAMILFPQDVGPINLDRDSIIARLETCGLAQFADATRRLPQKAFRDVLWPTVADEFRSTSWHCFKHLDGMIALTQAGTAGSLLTRLVKRPSEMAEGYMEYPICLKTLSFEAPVLVSGKSNEEPITDWRADEILEEWFTLKRSRLCKNDQKKLESLKKNKKKRIFGDMWSEIIDLKSLRGLAKDDVKLISKFLQGNLKRLW